MLRLLKLMLIAASMILTSCYYLQSTGEPLEVVRFPANAGGSATKDLMVLLPGIGDYPQAFQRNEFIRTLRDSGLMLDAVAVNSHIGYYTDRSLLKRLKEDVVQPAISQGYERIHFVGISLGGYGTLLYMRSHPEDVSSAILIAPYLGEPGHYNYLLDPSGWDHPAEGAENIWPWLESLPADQLQRVYLGYGDRDQYAEGHRLLNGLLPTGHTITVAGDHSWVTWQSLWPMLLSTAEALQDGSAPVVAER
ncbi:esterase family protein [Proteobacteria bacterium 005FR1]|nr:esterase family protein [Proteobacteria bacterium 005FR1]